MGSRRSLAKVGAVALPQSNSKGGSIDIFVVQSE